ncbi:MAG: VWA domain-containing protein [Dehalococcoidia bacterium]|nr:VWA domain-containing protein [Dehalococcoidia bacterium]
MVLKSAIYARWDGSQNPFDVGSEDLMEELSDEFASHGDVRRALRQLMRRGMKGEFGKGFEGIEDLLRQLKKRRQEQLDRHNLGGIFDKIKEKLDHILQQERGTLDRRMQEAQGGQPRPDQTLSGEAGEQGQDNAGEQGPQTAAPSAQGSGQRSGTGKRQQRQGQQEPRGQESGGQEPGGDLSRLLENVINKKQDYLNRLPPDAPGQIKSLTDYEFMDQEARREFQELLESLKQQAMQQYFQNMAQQMSRMTPEQMQALKQMLSDLNQMLQQQLQGQEPNFEQFMQQWGPMFGDNPPQSLEELMEQLQQQMSQMSSLLNSLSPQMRQELEQLLESALPDGDLRAQLQQLAANMSWLMPGEGQQQGYPFRGDKDLSLEEAMRLMEQLQDLERLHGQLEEAGRGGKIEEVDEAAVEELLGEDARRQLQRLKELEQELEQAGYIRRKGDRLELTPKGVRKIGSKALRDIFARLRKDRMGQHETRSNGRWGERADDIKKYEFGDPFYLNLERTLFNSIRRQGAGTPVALTPDDFEIYKAEQMNQSATVLMLDQSRSMGMTGCFEAAKKVALALHSLIKSQFPRDNLYLVGFADYAWELKSEALPEASWGGYYPGTNMHHALMIARQLLNKHKSATRQVVMVTDGEPTAHMEGGRSYFSYPPTQKTFQQTLLEVKRCTKENITINVFMLEQDPYLMQFMQQVTKINRGRAFFTSPDRLGEYILVDYLSNKHKRVV